MNKSEFEGVLDGAVWSYAAMQAEAECATEPGLYERLEREYALACKLLVEAFAEQSARTAELEARTTLAQCDGARRTLATALSELTEARQRIAELEAQRSDLLEWCKALILHHTELMARRHRQGARGVTG
jgi:hypothetical protein